MIRLIVPIIIIVGLILVGCSGMPQLPFQPLVIPNETDGSVKPADLSPPVQEQPLVIEEKPCEQEEETEETYMLKATPEVKEEEESPTPMVMANEPPEDRTWISPGKVQVGNFFPGARAEWDLSIHNGADEVRQFSIVYRKADRVPEGFGFPPDEAKNWVIIADADPILMPKETRNILIALELPLDAQVPPKWEFWIAVKDATQKKMITTALCSRWLVYMQ